MPTTSTRKKLKMPYFFNTLTTNNTNPRFPWPARSMKVIESCLDNLPLLHHLSGNHLPLKDLPFSYVRSKSNMAGDIDKEGQWKHQKQPNDWWLTNRHIQILCAFLLQNQSSNQFVHVIHPHMTKLMQVVYAEKIKLDGIENPTDEEKLHYHEQLQHFFKYVDSCQDFFDNKFLVLIYNLAQH